MSNIAQQEIATPDNVNNNCKVRSHAKLSATKYLTYTAVFAALAIVMKLIGQYLTFTPSFKVTLVYTVWLISGAALGIIGGGAVCFISEVLGAFIFPTGPINPLIVLVNTLYGVLGAIVFRFTPSKHYSVKFIAAGIACTVACTCILNSLAIWYWYGYYKGLGFFEYFALNRAFQPLIAAINIVITVAMVPLLIRTKLLPAQKTKSKSIDKEKQDA